MTTDALQDLELLENIQAAPSDLPMPEQNDPLRNVPEDTLRNLDTLVVDMEQTSEVADQAQRVATEALQIEQSGLMDQMHAEALAKDVPAVLGSTDRPVSYTSVPTNVGASYAVEILEDAAANSRDMAITKISSAIDRATVVAQSVLDKDEAEWLAAITNYAAARTNVFEATGGYPEDSYDLYLGNRPSGEVLMETIHREGGAESVSGSYDNFVQAIRALLSNGANTLEAVLFGIEGVLAVGETGYSLSKLAEGVIATAAVNDYNRVSAATWLLSPVNSLNGRREQLRAGMVALIEQLRILHSALNAHKEQPLSVAQTATSVQQSILLASLLARMNKALEGTVTVANAATQFYKDFAQGAPQPSADSQPHPVATERFAAPNRGMQRLLNR